MSSEQYSKSILEIVDETEAEFQLASIKAAEISRGLNEACINAENAKRVEEINKRLYGYRVRIANVQKRRRESE